MGVKGLTSFLDSNQELLKDVKLQDGKLVLDGNNIYHFIYYNYHVDFQHGGDYDHYKCSVRSFFNSLLSCNIKPYVIFDGAYEKNDRKLKTTLDRANNRIHSCCLIGDGVRGKVLPILAFEVFRDVCKEEGICHVTCDSEADNEIASLANSYQCPVLSNDSDFCIFNLTHGLVPLDYIDLQPKYKCDKSGKIVSKYIEAQVFVQSVLTEDFSSIRAHHMPLVATLFGNDYVSPGFFQVFFDNIKLPKVQSKRVFVSRRNSRMLGLLLWLESYDTVEEAMAAIVSHHKKTQRDQAMAIMQMSVKSYTIQQSQLQYYFEGAGSMMEDSRPLELSADQWLTRRLRNCTLPPFLLNAFHLRRIILQCQVEDWHELSSYTCSRGLRAVLYAILLPPIHSHVQEYDRNKKSLEKLQVEVVRHLEHYGPLPGVDDIDAMELKDRANLLLAALQSSRNQLEGAHPSHWLTLAVIKYWIMNAQPQVSRCHMYALVITMIKLNIIDTIDDVVKGGPSRVDTRSSVHDADVNELLLTSWADIAAEATRDEVREAKGRIARIVHTTEAYVAGLHAFSQLQSCLQAAMYLNQLLQLPLAPINPARLYSGSSVAAVATELLRRPNPLLYATETLGKQSQLTQFFLHFVQVIDSSIPNHAFTIEEEELKSFKKKKAKNKKCKKKATDKGTVLENSDSYAAAANVEEHTVSLTNRFDSLGVV